MKYLRRLMYPFIMLSLLGGGVLFGQNTTVTATVVDSDGTAWANAPYTLTFRPNPNNPNLNVYNINGVPLNPAQLSYSGNTNSSGFLSQAVYQNGVISPSGSQWVLSICPLSSAPSCGSYNISTGTLSSLDVSTNINANIVKPRFPAVAGAFGYADIEAQIMYPQGATYWNVIQGAQRYYFNGAWGNFTVAGTFCVGSCTVTSPWTLTNINGVGTTSGSMQINNNLGVNGTFNTEAFAFPSTGLQAAASSCSNCTIYVTAGTYTVAGSIATADYDSLIKIQSGQTWVFLGNPVINVTNWGTVSTAGTAVTWVSGTQFTAGMAGSAISINGVLYVVSTYNSATSLTLSSSAGSQAGVSYAMDYNHVGLFGFGLGISTAATFSNISFAAPVTYNLGPGMDAFELGVLPSQITSPAVTGVTLRDWTQTCAAPGGCGFVYIPQRKSAAGNAARQVANVLIDNISGQAGDTLFDGQNITLRHAKFTNYGNTDGIDTTAGYNVTTEDVELSGFGNLGYALSAVTLDASHGLSYGVNGLYVHNMRFINCSGNFNIVYIIEGTPASHDTQGIQNVTLDGLQAQDGTCNSVYFNPVNAANSSVPWGPFTVVNSKLNMTQYGIQFLSAGSVLQNCGVTISNNWIYTSGTNAGAGLYDSYGDNCSANNGTVISNNHVIATANTSGYYPVYIDNVEFLTFTGNEVGSFDTTDVGVLNFTNLAYSSMSGNSMFGQYKITELSSNTNEFGVNYWGSVGNVFGNAVTTSGWQRTNGVITANGGFNTSALVAASGGRSEFWDGTQGLFIGNYTGASGYGALYSTGVTPGASNYALAANPTNTQINSPSGGTTNIYGGGGLGGLTVGTSGGVQINPLTTNNAIPKHNASGLLADSLLVDSGSVLSYNSANVDVHATGTQVAGQVACIKAVGPPPVIGTCSGTVSATTGTCGTCN